MAQSRVEVHRCVQTVRWGDMDALGHVNNTLYFRYMEQARLEWFYAFARNDAPYAGETGPLIVNASCTFLAPIVYPATLEIVMSLGEPGNTSIGSFYELLQDGRRMAEGAARLVWITLADGRPTPLPDAIRTLVPA
jgi:acyl-CoA thioester hydrolase